MLENPFYQDFLTDGPYLHWLSPDTICFTYLKANSVETIPVEVPPEDFFVLKGQLQDRKQAYPIQRNPQPAAAIQTGVEKILIMGDMHGMYRKLFRFLEGNKVVDGAGRWSWGKGQLVFCGDLMDRGSQVSELLWFLYRLEKEAEAAGGAVHCLLGNHELMVMEGDDRYLSRKYQELFARQQLEYSKMFDQTAVFGQWIRSRNSVLRLNELLICHAGISPQLAAKRLSIPEINSLMQDSLQEKKVDESLLDLLKGMLGPFWYRAYFFPMDDYGRVKQDEVAHILQQYEVANMVVAHTTVDRVKALYRRKVFAVDLDVNNEQLPLEGLLIEKEQFFRLGEKGKRTEI